MYKTRYLKYPENVLCPICLETCMEGGHLRTDCGHTFHVDCLSTWLQMKGECPTCRADMRTPEMKTEELAVSEEEARFYAKFTSLVLEMYHDKKRQKKAHQAG